MEAFRRLVFSAVAAGLLAGLVTTVVHQSSTVPLILRAEMFETQAAPSAGAAFHHEAWMPQDGLQRIVATAIADVLTGIGFALILVAIWNLREAAPTWRDGAAWGLAGFVVVTLAPSLGLPAELPGTDAAALHDRQSWWLLTVLCTGAGLALLLLIDAPAKKLAGALLLPLPYLIGAPHPSLEHSLAPAILSRQFVIASLLSNCFFWLVLGATAAYFFKHPRLQSGLAARSR